jgi:hypothetical protein
VRSSFHRVGKLALAIGIATLGAGTVAFGSVASAHPTGGSSWIPGFRSTIILSGSKLHHRFTPVGVATATATVTESLANPDDITRMGNSIFVGFQNGVGPQGQPSTDGNPDSTVVEFTSTGHVLDQWDVTGKADGLTADPAVDGVIATVNEDADSSLYVIHPAWDSATGTVIHYHYNKLLPHGGGTDAISIDGKNIFISASAPGTTGAPAPEPTYPAVYSVTLDPTSRVASVTPLFDDEDTATVVNAYSGQFARTISLALTDPDSNEIVPWGARFGGDFMLTSQGDVQQIYVSGAGTSLQHLSVLTLSQSVDDTAWPVSLTGTLYATDSIDDTVVAISGPFRPGQPMVAATPCGSNSAPTICPGPGYTANYLATLNPWTGEVSAVKVTGQAFTPQGGLLFVPGFAW